MKPLEHIAWRVGAALLAVVLALALSDALGIEGVVGGAQLGLFVGLCLALLIEWALSPKNREESND